MRIMTLAVILAFWPASALAQRGPELFQQALVKERAEGNLTAAIQIYERILSEFPSQRTLAAKALLQLGICYEKLGQETKAEGYYSRLRRDYRDQPGLVEESHTQMARRAIVPPAPPPVPPPSVFKVSGRVIVPDADHNSVRFTGDNNKVLFANNIPADGTFSLDVPAGIYQAVVGPRTTFPVNVVVDRNIAGLELFVPRTSPQATVPAPPRGVTPLAGTLVTGRVIVDGGGGAPPPSFSMSFGGASIYSARVVNGTFQVQLRPGEYRVNTVALPPGYYLQSIRVGALDVYSETLKLGGTSPGEIIVTLKVE